MAQVYHMKGPKKEGQRETVYFPTRADLVEGLNEAIEEAVGGGSSSAGEDVAGMVKLYSTTGNNTDGAMTQAAITQALNTKVGANDTISSAKIIMGGGSTLQESWNSGGGGGGGGTADTLVLSTNTLEVKVGEVSTFAIATTSSDEITVTSDDTSIADVSLNGTTVSVTGVALGYSTITVTVGSLSQTCTAIVSKTKVTVPTVTNTAKTYSGSSQSPTISNEPSAAVATVTGKSATNAGNYILSYALVDVNRYEWADNTTGAKEFEWSLAKAAGSLSLSATSGMVYKGNSATFTVTTPSDGNITVTSGNTSVATVSLSGKTVTVTGVKTGSATITVSQAEGTNHLAPINATYAATVDLYVDDTLNNNSWETISEISQRGTGDTYWDVGDCKQITLNGKVGNQLTLTNQNLCVFILHFNYAMNGTAENNIIWGGFKSALTNGKDVALADAKYNSAVKDGTICFNMSHKTTATSGNAQYGYNYGGWKGSDLRYDILGATSQAPSQYNTDKNTSCVGYDATAATLTSPKANTLLAALPSDLRNVIRLWTRWIDAVGNSSNIDANIKATVDAITLLAEFEVQGARTYANEYEKNHQKQMAYYAAGNSKVRYKHSDTSSAVSWWCASPYYNYNYYFCTVNTSGGATSNFASISSALAPAFKT